MNTVCTEVQVAHVDAFGHVNNARHMEYLEMGRWAFFKSMPQAMQLLQQGLGMAVIDAHLKFHQAARLGQQLAIETKLESFQDSRVWLYQQIRLKDSGEILVPAEVLSVCIDTRAHRATNLPDELCQALSRKKEGQEWAEAGLRMPAAKPQKAGVAA